MGSQILRPNKERWLVQGSWGRRTYDPMSKVDFYERLHRELIESRILPADSTPPSNKYHDYVTMAVMQSSWINGSWIPDEHFASRLRRLRQQANLTQEQLAEKSGLDVGTIRQLEQGTRTSPQWQTVCALARGLEVELISFVGTEGSRQPESEEEQKQRELVEKVLIIERDIIMRLESLGNFFNRGIDKPRRADMKNMTKPELERLAAELKSAPNAQNAITMIVAAITASKAARRAEEEKKYDALGVVARVTMEL